MANHVTIKGRRVYGTIDMKWIELTELDQLHGIQTESDTAPVLIFKHSYRCNISRTALDRLERNWNDTEMTHIKAYFLDLLSNRQLSDAVAGTFGIEHESPQVLLISNGKAVLDLSHFEIDYGQIKAAIQ